MNNVNILPHEIHLTVDNTVSDERFIEICQSSNIKPIIFDLHLPITKYKRRYRRDLMTSTVINGTFLEANEAINQLKMCLEDSGLKVIREKIEIPPMIARTDEFIEQYLRYCQRGYFESHIDVDMTDTSAKSLRSILHRYRYYKSQVVKSGKRKKNSLTLTIRKYDLLDADGKFSFNEKIDAILTLLKRHNLLIPQKKEIEYCIYDSNTEHDAAWMN